MRAITLLNHFYAGLLLIDRADGEYIWLGTDAQWREFERLEASYDEHGE